MWPEHNAVAPQIRVPQPALKGAASTPPPTLLVSCFFLFFLFSQVSPACCDPLLRYRMCCDHSPPGTKASLRSTSWRRDRPDTLVLCLSLETADLGADSGSFNLLGAAPLPHHSPRLLTSPSCRSRPQGSIYRAKPLTSSAHARFPPSTG